MYLYSCGGGPSDCTGNLDDIIEMPYYDEQDGKAKVLKYATKSLTII